MVNLYFKIARLENHPYFQTLIVGFDAIEFGKRIVFAASQYPGLEFRQLQKVAGGMSHPQTQSLQAAEPACPQLVTPLGQFGAADAPQPVSQTPQLTGGGTFAIETLYRPTKQTKQTKNTIITFNKKLFICLLPLQNQEHLNSSETDSDDPKTKRCVGAAGRLFWS